MGLVAVSVTLSAFALSVPFAPSMLNVTANLGSNDISASEEPLVEVLQLFKNTAASKTDTAPKKVNAFLLKIVFS